MQKRIPFEVLRGEIRLTIPEISEAACLLVAQDARSMVGMKLESISAQEGRATLVLVTVDNAAGETRATPGPMGLSPEDQSRRFA